MNAEQFLDKTTDPEIKILASMVFSREGANNESVKRAQMLQDLKQRMETDIVHFFYRKGNGSLRSAYGTRDRNLIREHMGETKKEADKAKPIRTFTYFDIGRCDWRSFRPESIDRLDLEYAL